MARSVLKTTGALTAAPLAIGISLALGFDVREHESTRELVHRTGDFVGAATCQRCHPDQHASWQRTFHSTMTQRATPDAVVGGFDGQTVEFYGQRAKLYSDKDRYLMDLPAGGTTRTAEVVMAVGSRRYQQYFERVERERGFVLRRLPLLWHIGAQRWLHLNGVFLGWDDANWEKHAATWNQNCIFCHNTGPRPGYREAASELEFLPEEERAYESAVATLGIGCESCHGPGRTHVERYENAGARYADYLSTSNDPRIVHPGKLDKERSVAVCGQCHGQRIPKPLERQFTWRKTGPTFRSGDVLTDHVSPVRIDTRLAGQDDDVFALRFWADGTPRLTAYEYQGVTASPCYVNGPMTCGSCHVMHGGDVHGQIEPEMRGDRACTQCHADIARDVEAHTQHAPPSSGSRCLECHMPRMVYGILDVHRSHRIEIPDPKRDAEAGRPNACTSCHLDKSPLWAADQMKRLWGDHYGHPASRPDRAPLTLPDATASLLSGDAVQRVVFAKLAGRTDSPVEPRDKAALRIALITTLLDAYPSIRWTAQRSLLALERELPLGLTGLARWDHHAPREQRESEAKALFGRLAALGRDRLRAPAGHPFVRSDLAADIPSLVRLLNLQSKHAISIGE